LADERRLVTVATFGTAFEASLARGALQSIGIRAIVPGEELGTFCRTRSDTSTRTLQVFEEDHDRAVAELRRATMRGKNTTAPND
jgi:hypothetical protein